MELIVKTQLEQDIDALIVNIDTISRAAAATAQTLNNAHAEFWALPDDRLLAVLNSLGSEKVQTLFDSHFAVGNAINVFLETADGPATRAITVRGRSIVFENGAYALASLNNAS